MATTSHVSDSGNVPGEKISVGLLLCVGDVEECCLTGQYNDRTAACNQRRSARSIEQSSPQKLLRIAAGFPSNHQELCLKDLAKTLQEICQSQRAEEDFALKRFAKYYDSNSNNGPA